MLTQTILCSGCQEHIPLVSGGVLGLRSETKQLRNYGLQLFVLKKEYACNFGGLSASPSHLQSSKQNLPNLPCLNPFPLSIQVGGYVSYKNYLETVFILRGTTSVTPWVGGGHDHDHPGTYVPESAGMPDCLPILAG